jgi:formate hydrogenlyase subunit 3/multisubunit Na+/H+ antiporter MnhD subunit
MIIVIISILVLLLITINIFNFKIRTLAMLTLNIMIFSFIINLGYLFFIPKSYRLFESINLDISGLVINISSKFQLLNVIFYLDNISNLFILLITLLTPFALLTN